VSGNWTDVVQQRLDAHERRLALVETRLKQPRPSALYRLGAMLLWMIFGAFFLFLVVYLILSVLGRVPQ